MDVYLFYGVLLVLFIGFLIQGQRASKHGRADLAPRHGYVPHVAGVAVFVTVLAVYKLLVEPWLERIDGWTNAIWLLSDLLVIGMASLAWTLIERFRVRRTQAE